MRVQEIKYTESNEKLQKEVLLHTLNFASYLIDYYNIFLDSEYPLFLLTPQTLKLSLPLN